MLTGGHSYGILNTRFAPFDNPNVRRAVYLWVDRQQIIDNALNAAPRCARGSAPDYHSGYGTPRDQLLQNNIAFRPDKTEARADGIADPGRRGSGSVSSRDYGVGPLHLRRRPGVQPGTYGPAPGHGLDAKLESLDRTAGLEKLNDGGGWHAAYYGGAARSTSLTAPWPVTLPRGAAALRGRR